MLKSLLKKSLKTFIKESKQPPQPPPPPDFFDKLHLIQKNELNFFYEHEKYAHYLASTILFSLLHIPNIPSNEPQNTTLVETLHLDQDIEEAVQNGRYYHSYERDIIIYPDFKNRQFRVCVKRFFTSQFPNPVHKNKDNFQISFFYSTPTLRNNIHFVSLIINHTNYSDEIKIVDEDLDTEKYKFPYKRTMVVEKIFPAELYHVEFQTNYFTNFPIRFGSFRLQAPAKHFKVTVRIRTNEKRKLCLTLKNFGSYNKRFSNIDKIEPNSTMSYFENIDWTYPSSGYAYIVKPWNEYWYDFLPQIQKSTDD